MLAMQPVQPRVTATSKAPSPRGALVVVLYHHRYLLAAGVAAAVLILLLSLWLFVPAAGPAETTAVAGKAWYTTDDGKTWFADDKRRIAPFTHDGLPAYRCWVYTCDRGRTKFVAYLERYSPAAKQQLESIAASHQPPSPGVIDQLTTTGIEVKQPGGTTWVNASDPRAIPLREPRCPGGSATPPQPVLPP
jgi:hypothetical protein